MSALPVLISIPHGGTAAPVEVRDRIILPEPARFADSDAFTDRIYDVGQEAAVLLKATVARVFVDLNREEGDIPPQNPDGVVKTSTCHGIPVYRPGSELDTALTQTLVERYHRPYHKAIRENIAAHPEIKLGLDCHSMEAVGPAIAPDPGKPRPAFCLGNRMGKTCPDEMLTRMAQCLRESFDLPSPAVALNVPFAGGFITRTYGNNPIPWMQIEMNRNLYLSDPWFDKENLSVAPERLAYLREGFLAAVKSFFR